MHFLFDFLDVIYLKGKQCWSKDRALGTPDVTLPQVECDPLTETAWTLLHRKSFIHVKVDTLMP